MNEGIGLAGSADQPCHDAGGQPPGEGRKEYAAERLPEKYAGSAAQFAAEHGNFYRFDQEQAWLLLQSLCLGFKDPKALEFLLA